MDVPSYCVCDGCTLDATNIGLLEESTNVTVSPRLMETVDGLNEDPSYVIVTVLGAGATGAGFDALVDVVACSCVEDACCVTAGAVFDLLPESKSTPPTIKTRMTRPVRRYEVFI